MIVCVFSATSLPKIAQLWSWFERCYLPTSMFSLCTVKTYCPLAYLSTANLHYFPSCAFSLYFFLVAWSFSVALIFEQNQCFDALGCSLCTPSPKWLIMCRVGR